MLCMLFLHQCLTVRTTDFRYTWGKKERAAHEIIWRRRMICGLCSTGSNNVQVSITCSGQGRCLKIMRIIWFRKPTCALGLSTSLLFSDEGTTTITRVTSCTSHSYAAVPGCREQRWVDIAFADIDTIPIFITKNIVDINMDIDILYYSALWPTHIFHYSSQTSQWRQCYYLTSVSN